MTHLRKRRARPEHPGDGWIHTAAPNDVWTTDVKGEFRTGDGAWCYPLTLADEHTRYPLACRARPSTQTVTAWPIFQRAFREYGLPRASRSDNGAHERMHRSLKRRALRPAQPTVRAQQRAFDRFRDEYNEVRPHEALGMEAPASCSDGSPRAYPSRILAPEYPGHFTVKGVTTGGTFRFHNRLLYLANVLSGERVGRDEVDDGVWHIYFGAVLIATLDERNYIIRE